MSNQTDQDKVQTNQAVSKAVVITFLVMIISTLCFWYYHDIITWFPSHIHAWTQSDRLALAYGFLENGFDFFTPRTYNLYTADGITGVDFPIHEYLVAILMKIFGTNEPFIFRAYTLGYSLVGYAFLYLLARKITGRDIVAAVVVLFAFTAPILTYYQAGFIPSSTSLASSFIGFYFFFRFREGKKYVHLYWAIGLLTLAVLPRASVNIVLFAVLLVEVIRWWKDRKIDKKALVAFVIAYAIIAASIMCKDHLSSEYGTRFLASLMPASDVTHLMDILKESWSRWQLQLLTKYHWLLLGISGIASGIALLKGKLKTLDKEVLLISLLLFGGSVIFFLALARQLIAHEYYFMDSLYPAIILLLIPGLGIIGNSSGLGKVIWPLIFGGLLIGAAIDSKAVQDEKYAQTEWDRGEVTRKNFTGSDIFLDGLGIPRDAKILVFEAYSTNAPLLLMGRRGYTILNSREENIKRALQLDYDYIVVQDAYFPSDLIYQAPWIVYAFHRIGGNGRISIYTYHKDRVPGMPYPVQRSIPGLLGLNIPEFQKRLVLTEDSVTNKIVSDSSTFSMIDVTHRMTREMEFGGALVVPLAELNGADRLLIDLSFDNSGSEELRDVEPEFDVVLSIESPSGQKQYYKSFRVKRRNSNVAFYGYTCLFDIPYFEENDLTLKCYIWNRFKQELEINALDFKAYKSKYVFN